MNDNATLDTNLDAVCRPLTEREREVKDYVMKHFFEPLKQKHWEGVEIQEYKKKIKTTN